MQNTCNSDRISKLLTLLICSIVVRFGVMRSAAATLMIYCVSAVYSKRSHHKNDDCNSTLVCPLYLSHRLNKCSIRKSPFQNSLSLRIILFFRHHYRRHHHHHLLFLQFSHLFFFPSYPVDKSAKKVGYDGKKIVKI